MKLFYEKMKIKLFLINNIFKLKSKFNENYNISQIVANIILHIW